MQPIFKTSKGNRLCELQATIFCLSCVRQPFCAICPRLTSPAHDRLQCREKSGSQSKKLDEAGDLFYFISSIAIGFFVLLTHFLTHRDPPDPPTASFWGQNGWQTARNIDSWKSSTSTIRDLFALLACIIWSLHCTRIVLPLHHCTYPNLVPAPLLDTPPIKKGNQLPGGERGNLARAPMMQLHVGVEWQWHWHALVLFPPVPADLPSPQGPEERSALVPPPLPVLAWIKSFVQALGGQFYIGLRVSSFFRTVRL